MNSEATHGEQWRRPIAALLWTGAYVALCGLPLLAIRLGGQPGLGFWWDLSLGLGFSGLAIMGLQFLLTARFQRASAPFGSDILYHFHRWMAVIGLTLILVHYAVLRIHAPEALGPLLPGRGASWTMTAGRSALLIFSLLVLSSLARRGLKLEYDRWRVLHIVLAILGMTLAGAHVIGAGYYSRTPLMGALLVVFAVGILSVVLYVRVFKPWRLLGRPWRVQDVKRETSDTWTLTLAPEGHPGLVFSPGQFVWLTLGSTPFQAKEHPFSLSGSAIPGKPLKITIKERGDFTRRVGQTQPGALAWLDGPQGVFTVDRHPDAEGFVFIAGGVGIAPIMSMLRTLADREDQRPLRLVYGNDTLNRVIFEDELDSLARRLNLTITHVLENPPERWSGETGWITRRLLERVLPEGRAGLTYFVCGPKPMTEAVEAALRELKVPLGRLHTELFDMV